MSDEPKKESVYQKRKRLGLCVRCGKLVDREGVNCKKCAEKMRVYRKTHCTPASPATKHEPRVEGLLECSEPCTFALQLRYYERNIRKQLIEGQEYKFLVVLNYEKNGFYHVARRRLRLIRCYPHIAEFEDTRTGIRRSWRYSDIAKLLKGFAA